MATTRIRKNVTTAAPAWRPDAEYIKRLETMLMAILLEHGPLTVHADVLQSVDIRSTVLLSYNDAATQTTTLRADRKSTRGKIKGPLPLTDADRRIAEEVLVLAAATGWRGVGKA